MADNFSAYSAHLKHKYKDIKFKPIFFNGNLQDSEQANIVPIHLFCSIQDITEQGIRALTLNISNPKIESVTIFTNDNHSQPISDDKVSYVKCSKHFGLQLSDVTSYFKENVLNVFMYDIIVLDFDSSVYLHYLTNKQIGIFSAKVFDEDIPTDPHMFKNITNYHNINSEFNAIVVLGKLNAYDFYLDMYGSINLLIAALGSTYEIVNLSKIVIAYLFEEKMYTDTYISHNFPLIYAPVQLYFMEDLNVTIPEENVLESFSQEIRECVILEDLKYTQDNLPLDDQVLLADLRNKLRSEIVLSYKVEHEKQMKLISADSNEFYLNKKHEIVNNLEVFKKEQLEELDVFMEQEKKTNMEALEVQLVEERHRIADIIQEIEKESKIELGKKRAIELKKIDIEVQLKLDTELLKVNKILDDDKNRAYIAFKREIELFTTTAYSSLHEEIKEARRQKLEEVKQEIKDINTAEIERINKEHLTEKKRLEVLLTEWEAFKRQEIECLQQTEYLEKFSSSLLEIETAIHNIKNEKTRQLEQELTAEKETMYKNLRTDERFNLKECENKIKAYEQDLIKKTDLHVKELMAQKLKTEELRIENELHALKESKRKQMEEEETTRIKEQCAIVKEELLKQIHVELDLVKQTEYKKGMTETDSKLSLIYVEKLKKQDADLLLRESELKAEQDNRLEELTLTQVKEREEIHRTKLTECNMELQEYKTFHMKELNALLEQYKENELHKIELTKTLHQNEVNEYRIVQEKEIDTELSKQRRLKLKESRALLIKEKAIIQKELEDQFQETLEAKNKDQEREYSDKLQKKIEHLEQEHQSVISNLLSSSKRQYEDYLEECKKEKLRLKTIAIEEHNKQLKDLNEEYEEKTAFHKSLLKETIKEERQKLLASEKDCIAKELSDYKQSRIAELEKEIDQELAIVKQEKVLTINSEVLSHKEEKLKELTVELSEWKRKQEELLKKKFQSLYSDLQSL
jgi:hypothetical protein